MSRALLASATMAGIWKWMPFSGRPSISRGGQSPFGPLPSMKAPIWRRGSSTRRSGRSLRAGLALMRVRKGQVVARAVMSTRLVRESPQ